MTLAQKVRVFGAQDSAVSATQRGMTLVEMLVVLAIIAITASVSVLALGSDSNLRGRAEAKRIEAHLQLAADQTMIGDTLLALSIEPEAYRFLEFDLAAGDWRPLVDTALADPFELPRDMKLTADGSQTIFPLGAEGAGQPFALNLEWKENNWKIAFDGMTARIIDDRTQAARAGPP